MQHNQNVTDQFLRVPEFAEALGVQVGTVHRWIRTGALPAIRLGRRILIPADALRRLLERQEKRDVR
jgi:excisionase family DNA binding protein